MTIDKKITGYIIAFFAGIILTLSVVLPACNRRVNRANTETAVVREQLQSALSEVRRSGNTISEIRRIQSEITDGLRESNSELHSIIERLTLIRDKVSDIESQLSNYYSYYDSFDNLQFY